MAVESALEDQNKKSQFNPGHEERECQPIDDSNYTSREKGGNETEKGKTLDFPEKGASKLKEKKETSQPDAARSVPEHGQTELRTVKDATRSIDRSQIAATRTSLDHTITVSIIFI